MNVRTFGPNEVQMLQARGDVETLVMAFTATVSQRCAALIY